MAFSDVLKTRTTLTPEKGFGAVLKKTKPAGMGGGFQSVIQKRDLTTLEGLYNTAVSVGLKEQADRLLEEKGEDPEKIFSGGIVSDVFDALNMLQYGVVGVLKGKGFTKGVQERESFTKEAENILDMIVGIGLDIAVDPLTYVAPWTVLKKVGVAKKIVKGAKIAKETKLGQWFGRKFIYRFGQDPVYKELAERSIKNIAVSQQNLMDLVRPLTKLSAKTQRKIAEFRKAGKLEELPEKLLKKVKPIYDELDKLGKEAVEAGLLPDEIWAKNMGRYIPRLYKTKELPVDKGKRILGIFPKKPKRIDMSRFMKRKDIPEDIRKAMGEIMEAGYPTAKGLIQLKTAVEQAKFFKEVAEKWGSKVAKTGFEKLPDTKRLGALAGKYVPKPIYDDIQEIIRPYTELEKITRPVIAGFKFSKVILNPATHARNIMSNFILNSWEGLNPWRLDIYGEAAKQLAKKGKWYKEAQKAGLGISTYTSRAIKNILLNGEGLTIGKKFGKTWRDIVDKLGNIYQGEEEFAKLAQYIYQRKLGKSIDEAWRIAERATFNYAQVTPFIRRLRESIWGFPFITFTYKATPQAIKTIGVAPTKISNIGKIKNAIENMAGLKELKKERAVEPSWVRDGFYIKLPLKDKFGRSAYFDLTYIIPFGDLVSGEFWERRVERETGVKEGILPGFMRKSPLFNLIKELASNQDFYGNKIWKDGDTTEQQLKDIFRHIVKTYAPPLISDQIPGGYYTKGRLAGQRRPSVIGRLKEVKEGTQYRTLGQELLRNVGLKIQPIDLDIQETYMEWEKKKALQTLLKEAGVISEFSRYYIPRY